MKYDIELDLKMTAGITVEDDEGLSEDLIIEKAIEQFFWGNRSEQLANQ